MDPHPEQPPESGPGLLPEGLRPPPVQPLDVDGVRVVTVGTALWALAFVALLPFAGALREDGNGEWLGVTGAGAVLGVYGLWYCRRRRDRLRRGPDPRP